MILGREGIHRWTAADGNEFEINRLKEDDGDAVRPYVKLRRAGLASLGDAEDNRFPKVGGDGEIARLSRRRGKTVPYEGVVRAGSARELREYQSQIRQVFSDRSNEGRMDVFPHPLNPDFGAGEGERFFSARVIGLEMEDVKDSQRFESTFVLGLRMSDQRYFQELTTDLELADYIVSQFRPELYVTHGATNGLTDQSGNGHNGTAAGGLAAGGGASLTGIPGGASANYDGANDAVTFTGYDPFVSPGGLTVVMRMQPDTTNADDIIFCGSNTTTGPAFKFSGSAGETEWEFDESGSAAGSWITEIVDDETITLALGIEDDGGTSPQVIQWRNGRSDGPGGGIPDAYATSGDLVIGGRVDVGWFDGLVGPAMTFHRILTRQEHVAIHEALETGLGAYW